MTSMSNIGDEHQTPKGGLPLMVYVISKTEKPLMPTERNGKVRRLLRQKLAKIIEREPFTIRPLYDTTSGKKIDNSAKHGKLRVIERAKALMLERRKERIALHHAKGGVCCARI